MIYLTKEKNFLSGGEIHPTKLLALQKVLQSEFLSAVREVYEHIYETLEIQVIYCFTFENYY